MKKILKYIIFLLLCFIPYTTFAHIPRLVSENKVQVQNPDISQAFYAELKGKPDVYYFSFDKRSPYYIGLLAPKIDGIDKDYTFEIYNESDNNKLIAKLSGKDRVWSEFYEPFAGDFYWQGPEIRGEFEPGKYKVKVFSPDNKGKYVIAIGEKEQFLGKDIIDTIKVLPKLKHDYFGKSYFSVFANRVGLFLLGTILILTGIIVLIVWLVRLNRKQY